MKRKNLGYSDAFSCRLFILCWIAYFSTYICRLNFSVVMPELISAGELSGEQASVVSSAFFVCYGAGQLVSGRLGDTVSARLMIFLGTLISALSNIALFTLCTRYAPLVLLWGVNGAAQSLVWSPILRVAADNYKSGDLEKFGTDISTTVTLGTLACYAVSLAAIKFLGVEAVFLVCGCCTLAASVLWLVCTGRLGVSSGSGGEKKKSAATRPGALARLFVRSGCLVLLIPICVHGALKDSVTQWTPTFLSDSFSLGADISVVMTMLLPVVNVSGAYIARFICRKIGSEMLTGGAFFAFALVFLAVMTAWGARSSAAALICVAAVTTCMHAANVMFITMVPLRLSESGCTSTIGGILNAAAYIGCGLLNVAAGSLIGDSQSSWNAVFIFWLALCVVGILFTLLSELCRRKLSEP